VRSHVPVSRAVQRPDGTVGGVVAATSLDLANPCACVRACMRACVHACVCACVRAWVRACVRACMRACVHTCVRARVRTCVRACVRACVYACVRGACVHVCVRAVYTLPSKVNDAYCSIRRDITRSQRAQELRSKLQ
jgi:hypothetical protein